MRNTRAVLLLAVLLCALAGIGDAATVLYTLNAQSVTDTGVSLSFTDNGSGGTAFSFPARHVFVKNDGATNEVFCDVRDTTATTSDLRIDPGEAFTFVPSPISSSPGFAGIGCITSTGETTTIRVRAQGN